MQQGIMSMVDIEELCSHYLFQEMFHHALVDNCCLFWNSCVHKFMSKTINGLMH